VIVGAVLLVLAAGVVATLARGSGAAPAAPGGPASTASFSAAGGGRLVSGTPLPDLVDGAHDIAVGRRIPAVSGTDLDGRAIRIRPDDGRPKALLFLAHWCVHCQAEVPVVQQWMAAGGPKGAVDVIAIATANDTRRPNYPPKVWLERERWNVPTVLDDADASIGQAFGLSAFPYWVFVDAKGEVVQRLTGELTVPEIERAIAETTR
jgi:thiol-disulfide isomerase/thioredoxin